MGRRKIEIQPITHERNRSVTFVKRKNGLFKKAYELGVLCSVDVAVIIFEERPGHHLKLYQYCSSDIQDIVQRHLRHDGEKDTRGPADFSGNSTIKLDDLGDGDDDDADDDGLHRVSKRRNDGKLKSGDSPTGVDLGYSPQLHRAMPIPTPPISLGMPQSGGNTSSLPVSSDRHSVARSGNAPPSKKLRTEGISIPRHSDSSSDDAAASASSSNTNTYSYVSPTTASGYRPSSQGQYGNYFPGTPSPSYNVPNTFDAFHSSRSQRSSGGGTGTTNYPPRSTSYDAALFPHMVRQSNQAHSSASGAASHSGGGSEIFSFLDTENSHSRTTPSSASNFTTSMDWPVHSGGGHSSAPPGSGTHSSSGQPPSSSGDSTWLDFLTPNPVAGGGGGSTGTVSNTSGANGRRSSDAMSWERSGGRTGSTMGSPLSRSMTALGGVGGSAKRPRMGSGSGGEDDTSTSGGNSRSNGISRTDITIKQEKDGGG